MYPIIPGFSKIRVSVLLMYLCLILLELKVVKVKKHVDENETYESL